MGDLLRLVVVDDHLTFAEALGSRLHAEPDLHVVATVGSPEQMWAVLGRERVDVVLLDLDDERPDGTAVLHELRQRCPDCRVVVIAARSDPGSIIEAVRDGVAGWVPKEQGIGQLLDTVRGVGRDETWIPAPLLTGVLQALTAAQQDTVENASLLARLTPREREVLQCMVDGMSRAEVAGQLHLSRNTVRTHVQHLLHKLGVHSSLTAVAVARNAGLVSRAHRGPEPGGQDPDQTPADRRVRPPHGA
ncbi:MAG: LuxR C-terminal-related transcriptional regulator [Kineosporiaceae bacterium]